MPPFAAPFAGTAISGHDDNAALIQGARVNSIASARIMRGASARERLQQAQDAALADRYNPQKGSADQHSLFYAHRIKDKQNPQRTAIMLEHY